MTPEPTTPEQLARWLDEPEGTRFEFQEAKQRFDFENLVRYCVALANEGGGTASQGVLDTHEDTAVVDGSGRDRKAAADCVGRDCECNPSCRRFGPFRQKCRFALGM